MAGSSLAAQQQQQQHPFIHPMVAHNDPNIVIHGKFLHITDIHVSEILESSMRVTQYVIT